MIDMQRTTIMLDRELKSRIERRPHQEGVSLAEWLRREAARALDAPLPGEQADPLFTDNSVLHGDTPEDLALRHDDHLYEAP